MKKDKLTPKKKVGRRPFNIDNEMLEKVKNLAARGLTQKQIGDAIGISHQTMAKYKNKNAEFVEAIKEGQALGIAEISNALFDTALSGNVAAQIFYMKNRAGWTDKQEVEHSGGVSLESTILNGLNPDS